MLVGVSALGDLVQVVLVGGVAMSVGNMRSSMMGSSMMGSGVVGSGMGGKVRVVVGVVRLKGEGNQLLNIIACKI